MELRLFERSISLHNVFFRTVVPHAHAHVLPGAGGEFGDAGAVEFRRQARLRVKARICPCHVRAVPLILAAAAAAGLAAAVGAVVLAAGLVVGLAVVLLVLVLAVLLFAGQSNHLALSMPRGGLDMRAGGGDFVKFLAYTGKTP